MHYFIAKNFLASMNTTGKITNVISVVGISLGSFALIISISVLNGFENKLDEKISNFDGHLRIPNSISNDKYELQNLVLPLLTFITFSMFGSSFISFDLIGVSKYLDNSLAIPK